MQSNDQNKRKFIKYDEDLLTSKKPKIENETKENSDAKMETKVSNDNLPKTEEIFDILGYATYLRTYSRKKEDGTMETWNDTINRVIGACKKQLHMDFTEEEEKELKRLLYTLKISVAGRFLWQLGTDTVDKYGLLSLQNCALTTITNYKDFKWIMDALMLGAGIGMNITRAYIEKLPMVLSAKVTRKDTKDADFIVPDSREGWVQLLGKVLKAHFFSGKDFTYSTTCLRSKGAVIKAFGGISSGPEMLCEGIAKISEICNRKAGQKLSSVDVLDICNILGMIVVSGNVRRCIFENELVETKNGHVKIKDVTVGTLVLTSNGYYKVLNNFYQGKQRLVNIKAGKSELLCTLNHRVAVSSNDGYIWKQAQELTIGDKLVIHDTNNNFIFVPINSIRMSEKIIGETYDIEVETKNEFYCNGLLVHNSAEIALGDPTDKDYLRSKRWDLGNIPNTRCYSNNSVICNDINDIIDNDDFWSGYEGKGEPFGLVNLGLSRNCGRLGDFEYLDQDACGMNPCGEIVLSNKECCCLAEVFLPKIVSLEELKTATKYLYRICKHSLTLPCHHKDTEDIMHKNMRMGIGVTGYMQATEEQKSWLPKCYEYLREFDIKYSKKYKINKSIRIGTCKPSGTLSILGNVTPGVHPAFAQYYIRRVRFSSESPIVQYLKDKNYPVEFNLQFDGSYDHTTSVVSFPCKVPHGTILAKDCTAIDQLKYVRRVQTDWSDNSVSVTCYYKKEELPAIKQYLKENYNHTIKSVSFLLHQDSGFKQMPLEEITKEKYEEMVKSLKPVNFEELHKYVDHGKFNDESDNSLECAGGACPIK